MATSNLSKVKRQKDDVYNYINVTKLPGLSQDYLDYRDELIDQGRTFSYLSDFYNLRAALVRCPCDTNEEKFYRILFLCITNYFLYDYRAGRKYIKDLEELLRTKKPYIGQELINYALSLKYKMIKLDKISLLVTNGYSISNGFEVMRDKFKYKKRNPNLSINIIKDYNEANFINTLKYKEQVFIFAHGDDDGLTLGTRHFKNLTPEFVINILKSRRSKLPVLGMFSCGEAFNIPEIRKHADYFMTDENSAYSDFAELFIYGYLRNYFKTLDITSSYAFGLNVPVIRTDIQVSVKMFEFGKPIF